MIKSLKNSKTKNSRKWIWNQFELCLDKYWENLINQQVRLIKQKFQKKLTAIQKNNKFKFRLKKIKKMEDEMLTQFRLGVGFRRCLQKVINRKDITNSSLELYCSYINNFVKWLSDNHSEIKEMKEVSKKIVEEYFVHVANTKSVVIFNASLALFKKIWNNFKDEGRYVDNPFNDISRRKNEGSKRGN